MCAALDGEEIEHCPIARGQFEDHSLDDVGRQSVRVRGLVGQVGRFSVDDDLGLRRFLPDAVDRLVDHDARHPGLQRALSAIVELTDLHEDLAAEQKARTTYDNILRLVKDPEVCEPIRFLRAREIVHYQRFGEAIRIVQDNLDSRNFYAFNPEFDK